VSFDGTGNIDLPGVNASGNQATSGTAAIATTVTVADESSDTTCFPLFATAATGDLAPKSGTNLAFNSATGALTATSFVGTAPTPTVITIADESSDTTCFPLFVTAATGDLGPKSAAGLTFNSSTDVLSGTFAGNITGNVTGNTSGTSGSTTGNAAGLSSTLVVGSGGSGATSLTANGVLIGNGTSAITSVDMSTKGKILIGDGSGNPQMLSIGSNGQVLTAASGQTTGVEWATAASDSLQWQTIVTGSTLTAVAGRAYWINTTSNTCTITLPSSASNGDQIIFADYARKWATNKIIIDSNGLKYQGNDDTYTVEYNTAGETLNIVYSGATNGWIPLDDDAVAFDHGNPSTQKAIFGYGNSGSVISITNLVSSSGVVATDVTGVGTARDSLKAASYGVDKAIFAYGFNGSSRLSMSNLVNNSGVVATDVTGVGTARQYLAAAEYGVDKAIFGYGTSGSSVSVTNLVSSSGVVSADVTGVGTARYALEATRYGTDKAIFGYGYDGSLISYTNKVSNLGVVSADVSGVGTGREGTAAAGYGGDKAIFGYGYAGGNLSMTNLVSNTGVVAADVTGVGTARRYLAAASYGTDKVIFGYGIAGGRVSITNLVNNSGVVATDTTGVGTARNELAAAGYSTSA